MSNPSNKRQVIIAGCIESLRKKGWYFCAREACKYLFPIRWIGDKTMMDRVCEKRAYNYLKRRYIPYLKEFKPVSPSCNVPSKIIWVAWLQGEENAPELVKKCMASIRKYAGDNEVKVIDNQNLANYIAIPDYITKRLMKHQMQYAQYSDYIRVALLVKHGGIWIDSTVLLTGSIPQKALNNPLFLFKSSAFDNSVIKCSSWFIAAQKNNEILQRSKYIFEMYWKHEHKLCDYYLFHLILSAIVDSDTQSHALWKDIPFANNIDVHRLQAVLLEPYSDRLMTEICSASSIHKLTYKFHDQDTLRIHNIFYWHLIQDTGSQKTTN